jgi:serine/threonine protein kinase
VFSFGKLALPTTRLLMNLPSRYEVISKKGAGGFGDVLHARDKWLERDIAIKVLDPLMALEETERLRFQNEAKILARMSHPNIPSIYDVVFTEAKTSEDGEAHFQLIFEYIAGQTLQDYLRDEGPASLDDARRWFRQLTSALSHAHDLNVIHRDIKPANIIIRSDGESCVLVDFGIALTPDEADRLTKKGYVIGTPGYMSPEQQAGEELDHRSDIYNLGVCLYETLAGIAIQPGDYRPLASVNELIPPAIDELVQNCLEAKERRLPNAQAFATDLASALTPRASLTIVLAEGRLSDLETALAELTPPEFAERPAGQRALIVSKVVDLTESGNPRLEAPIFILLQHLVRLGVALDPSEYEEIIELSLTWGFKHKYQTGEVGKARIRRELAQQAASLPPGVYSMVAEKVLDFLGEEPLEDYDEFQLNGVRELVSNLMANRSCEKEAVALAKIRRQVDSEQRKRFPAPSTAPARS